MRILVASTAFPAVPELLRELLPQDDVVVGAESVSGPVDVIVPLMSRVDAALMDRLTPRLIQQFGVGLEGVDARHATDRGITVANVDAGDTGNADGVGEIALLHLLALTRRFGDAGRAVGRSLLGEPAGTALTDATVVVLGLGAIGRAVVQRLSGFGARLVGVGSREPEAVADRTRELGFDAYFPVASLNEALRDAHALVVCCVLNDQTRGLVAGEAFAAMPAGGYVVNVARGPVLDYDALLAALRAGHVGGAGLDVYWDEPIDPQDPLLAENVTVTPHIGGVTTQSNRRIAERVVANIELLRRGEPVQNAA